MQQPPTLHAAVISLYATTPDGLDVVGDPIFVGACAENLDMTSSLDVKRIWPTGDQYASRKHVGETHQIKIGRIWLTDTEVEGKEFQLVRNMNYILLIQWYEPNAGGPVEEDDDIVTRTYYGVTVASADTKSNGIHEFMQDQVFDAQYYINS